MTENKPVLSGPLGSRALINGQSVLMMGSNNYLGLANHPRVIEAAINAVSRYGAGTCMNPPLATTPVGEELRAAIADFHGTEDALLFTSCTAANMALVDTIAGHEDVVLSDALNHASIIDGCRLSRAEVMRYPHRDMAGLDAAFSEAGKRNRRLIISDGVFSMEGTVAPVSDLLEFARRKDCLLAIDESHAAGVVGARGRGTSELQNCLGALDFVTGTFSKALGGGGGGYICTTRAWRKKLAESARMAIFSSPLQPVAAACALAAVKLIRDDPLPVETLLSNARRFRKGLRDAGFNVADLASAIVPLHVGEAQDAGALCSALLAKSIYIPAVSFPVVPRGQAMLRIQISASHSVSDLDFAVETLADEARKLGLARATA